MSDYKDKLKNKTFSEEPEPQLYQSYPLAFLDNEYEDPKYSDADRLGIIVKALHSIEDTKLGGRMTESDFLKISFFLTDKYSTYSG